jgi:hypothetical protein
MIHVYVVDATAQGCAEGLSDNDLRTACVNYALIATAAHWKNGTPWDKDLAAVDPAKPEEPWVQWVIRDISHYYWMLEMMQACWMEYQHRFQHDFAPLVTKFKNALLWNTPTLPSIYSVPAAPPDDVIPEAYRNFRPDCGVWENFIRDSRCFYHKRLSTSADSTVWTNRSIPIWHSIKATRMVTIPLDKRGRKTFKKIVLDNHAQI